jgi:hypothetical protein
MSSAPFLVMQYKTSDIKVADYNPREITKEAFSGLKKSIERFGFIDPLIVNLRTGTLVAGHQRLRAAKALKLKTVPVIEVNLTEAEEKALNVTLNNPNIAGTYTDALGDLLQEIRVEFGDEDFQCLNLGDLDIDDLLADGDRDLEAGQNTEKENEIEDGTDVPIPDEHEEEQIVTIKVRCPESLRDEVTIFLKRHLLETSFEGVEVS